MCGIAGIISNNNAEPNLKAMLTAMKHRGPDDRGTWIKDGVHLGHNRLAIIDLSPAGHQPMISASGRYVMVYNGEVYNFQSLRNELMAQGVNFRSHSDTEVILALWELEQESCVSKLRGMFALAVWDVFEKKLTLIRDRLGIKPLYYAQTQQGFIFASEIKGMLASGLVQKEINEVAIALILQKGYVQQPHTILKNVHALMPGQIFRWSKKGVSTKNFWQLQNKGTSYKSEQEAVDAIRTLVIDAVNEEMVSDRPVGVFLSGGLDSTILVAALRAAGQSDLKTFTVGFDSTNSQLSESVEAQQSAQFYDTEHHDIQVESVDAWKSIDAFIEAIDQPSIDGLNVWLVSQKTAEHVTVAISGLGGDELFSGYSIDRTMLYWRENNAILLNAIHLTAPIWKNFPIPGRIKRGLEAKNRLSDFTDAYLSWGEVNTSVAATQIAGFKNGFQEKVVYKTFDFFRQENCLDLLQQITAMHIHTFMSGRVLTISDACAMAHSLEVRFPLIDHRLVDMAYNLPQAWRIKHVEAAAKMKNFEAENNFEKTGIKHLLYQAFKSELPVGFGQRSKKGFKLPFNLWLKSGLEEQVKSVLFNPDSYFPSPALRSIWDNWNTGANGWGPVWTAFIIESWIKKYIR